MVAQVSDVGTKILKRMYANIVNDHLNSRDDIMGRMPKDYDADGQEFYKLHRVGGTSSIRFQAENEILPTAGKQSWQNSIVTPSECWGTLSLTQRLIAMSKTNPGAFMRGFDSEIYGFSNDYRKFMEMILSGNGNGFWGRGDGSTDPVSTDTKITLRNVTECRRFTVGETIEAYDVQDNTAAAKLNFTTASTTAQIKSIDLVNKQIELEAALDVGETLTATTFYGRAGMRTQTARYTFIGIDGAVDNRDTPLEQTSGFQSIIAPFDADPADGITRTAQTAGTAEPTWASPVLQGTTPGTVRPISERILQEANDSVEITGNGMVDVYICPYSIRLDYAVGQLNLRRNVNTNRIAGQTSGGFQEDTKAKDFVQYADLDVIPWRFCRENVIYAMSWDRQKLKFWARPQWWEDGNILHKAYGRTTGYEAEMFSLLAYCMEERNAHARIEDIEGTEIAA